MGVLGRGWWPSEDRDSGAKANSNASAALELDARATSASASRSTVVASALAKEAKAKTRPGLVEAAAGSSDPFLPSSAFDPFVGSPSPSANPRTGVSAAAKPASATSASRRSLSHVVARSFASYAAIMLRWSSMEMAGEGPGSATARAASSRRAALPTNPPGGEETDRRDSSGR